MASPSLTKQHVINPGAVPFPARWEFRAQSAFMAGMATCVMRMGFAASRVEDVVALARGSRRTFYAHFDNIEQCLFDTHAAIVDDALAAIDADAESLDVALRGLMTYYAAWPAHAHVLLLAMPAAGPEGLKRHEAAQEAIVRRVSRWIDLDEVPDGLTAEQLLQARFGAAHRLVERQVVKGNHRSLPRLVPALSTAMTSLAMD